LSAELWLIGGRTKRTLGEQRGTLVKFSNF